MDMAAREEIEDEKTEHRHVVLEICCDATEVSPDGSLSPSGNVILSEAEMKVEVLDDLHATRRLSDLGWKQLRIG